jgi:hypothetical protein
MVICALGSLFFIASSTFLVFFSPSVTLTKRGDSTPLIASSIVLTVPNTVILLFLFPLETVGKQKRKG